MTFLYGNQQQIGSYALTAENIKQIHTEGKLLKANILYRKSHLILEKCLFKQLLHCEGCCDGTLVFLGHEWAFAEDAPGLNICTAQI